MVSARFLFYTPDIWYLRRKLGIWEEGGDIRVSANVLFVDGTKYLAAANAAKENKFLWFLFAESLTPYATSPAILKSGFPVSSSLEN